MGQFYGDITKTIGNTPLVKLNRITKGVKATVLAKLESFNPMGNVKGKLIVVILSDTGERYLTKPLFEEAGS